MIFSAIKRLTLLTVLLLPVSAANAAETDCLVRDPSTIVKHGDTYWIYGTGHGTQQFSSKDKFHWTFRGPVLKKAPDWLAQFVPGNRNTVWAPDIHLFHGTYYLYSAYSVWGSNNSGIGLATSTTLDPDSWVDQGMVVASHNGGDVNAIDPCIFEDVSGKPWLSYGSYVSGIKLIQLDPVTGKASADNPTVYSIATRPGVPGNVIEASAITYHNGYYYLFVNWDRCCAGSKSTYNIRMGRSRLVIGPYLDKTSKDMMLGGGTLFLGAVSDNGSGRPPDDEDGPGHFGILHDIDGDWLSTHYEWARDKNGATTVNVQKLAWDSDGWPRPVMDPGPYQITTFLATHSLLTAVKGKSTLQTWPDKNDKRQSWTLAYQGDGYYQLLTEGKALTVSENAAKPGSPLKLTEFSKRDGQLWSFEQNNDGTYTLLPKSGGHKLALDIGDCSLNDGANVGLWTALGNDCQKWTFRRREK